MGINRRRKNRRVFKINKNYIIPFICISITCATIIVSTNIILDLQKQIEAKPIVVDNGQVENEINKSNEISLKDKEKKQINNAFSFIMSNLDVGQDITNDKERYFITCKYGSENDKFKKIDEQYIDSISADTYRNLGYVYFEDFKDTYMYMSKNDFEALYNSLFITTTPIKNIYSDYYISDLDGFVVPKNNYIYDNSKYKVQNAVYNEQTNTYVITLLEINVLKLYEEKEYTKVSEYLENVQIDNNYLTGKILKVQMKKINDIFVFEKYAI